MVETASACCQLVRVSWAHHGGYPLPAQIASHPGGSVKTGVRVQRCRRTQPVARLTTSPVESSRKRRENVVVDILSLSITVGHQTLQHLAGARPCASAVWRQRVCTVHRRCTNQPCNLTTVARRPTTGFVVRKWGRDHPRRCFGNEISFRVVHPLKLPTSSTTILRCERDNLV